MSAFYFLNIKKIKYKEFLKTRDSVTKFVT